MLVKEYHIPLPLTVEEYRIAQLYMIQKKSREESEGEGSAVEIIENRPYTDGPNGSGQYTYKIYHIGRHLPSWFRSMAPKTALEVHEESWNAYPYTKTKFSVPFVEKFTLEVETYFEPDAGTQENIFKLTSSQLRQREVDVIDIVNDQLSGSDYKKEEDPNNYISQQTGRGPLAEDWISNPPHGVIMCSYKLIKVEFRYWGLQSKVERFIHDYGLRRVMLRAHRQAWAWQDEWVGLTMEDIRRLERETQLILQQKLGRVLPAETPLESGDKDGEVAVEDGMNLRISSPSGGQQHEKSDQLTERVRSKGSGVSLESSKLQESGDAESTKMISKKKSLTSQTSSDGSFWQERRKSSFRFKRDRESVRSSRSHRLSDASLHTLNRSTDHSDQRTQNSLLQPNESSDDESMYSTRPEWGLDQIAMISDGDSDAEFFDAQEIVDDIDESDHEYEEAVSEMETGIRHPWTMLTTESIDLSGDELGTPGLPRRKTEICYDADPTPSPSADILFLILHGGSSMDARINQVGKSIDFQTFSKNIQNVIVLHFRSAIGRIALRMVPCPNLCSGPLNMLCEVNPVPMTLQESGVGLLPSTTLQPRNPVAGHGIRNTPIDNNLGMRPGGKEGGYSVPVGAIPLLATEFHGYSDVLTMVSAAANKVYREFLRSEEGQNFAGQVCLLADCMGSVIAYDILTSSQQFHSRSSSPSPSPPSCSPLLPSRQRKISSQLPATSTGAPPNVSPVAFRVQTSSLPNRSHLLQQDVLHPPSILKQNSLGSRSPSVSSITSLGSANIVLPDSEGMEFCFEVTHFFAFGSPLGLVLASRRARARKTCRVPPPRPRCIAFYNLFYTVDFLASRIEPLLDERFVDVLPISVPRYRLYPTGMAKPSSLKETIAMHPYLFGSQTLPIPTGGREGGGLSAKKSVSSECLLTLNDEASISSETLEDIKPFSVWWSANRIDYALETPRGTDSFDLLPTPAFAHIMHSRYWEAKELVSFVLRQVLHHDTVCVKQTTDGKELIPFVPPDSVVQWSRKTTAMKIQHMRSNHRASDMAAVDSGSMPTVTAKFQYGPLAMASLIREMVDVYILMQGPRPKWQFLNTVTTDKHGRVSYTLPEEERLPPGLYPMKFLVKGDHTTASCNLFIVPPHTEVVVFSVDGALASNFSFSARDIKIKPGAVEVARCWQDLGYLIIYITGRSDVQKEYVLSFLGTHAFPLGLVACADGLSIDSHNKTLYLARLIKETKMIIHAAYGSQRHLAVYMELGLQPDQIFIHGKKLKKPLQDCQYLTEGFAGHLAEIQDSPPRRAMFDVRQLLGDVCFALPGKQKLLAVAGSKKRQSRSSLTPRTNPGQSNDSKHQVQSSSKQTTV